MECRIHQCDNSQVSHLLERRPRRGKGRLLQPKFAPNCEVPAVWQVLRLCIAKHRQSLAYLSPRILIYIVHLIYCTLERDNKIMMFLGGRRENCSSCISKGLPFWRCCGWRIGKKTGSSIGDELKLGHLNPSQAKVTEERGIRLTLSSSFNPMIAVGSKARHAQCANRCQYHRISTGTWPYQRLRSCFCSLHGSGG